MASLEQIVLQLSMFQTQRQNSSMFDNQQRSNIGNASFGGLGGLTNPTASIGGGGHGQSQFGNKDRSIEKTRPGHMASQYMFDASAGGQGYSPQIGDMGDHLTQPSVGMVNQFTVPPQE